MRKNDLADLYTAEGVALTGQPWNVYPRPALRRDSFFCLNGEWEFYANGVTKETILVPFAPESLLSGIHRSMGKVPRLTYKKEFTLPSGFVQGRVLLHFGAVDQIAEVTLNGAELGRHIGGYTPFTFDITEHLQGTNLLEVRVTDRLSDKLLPYGKQCQKRGGMWYTPVSGIWQTVWIESVPEHYVHALQIETGADYAILTAEGVTDGEVMLDGKVYPLTDGKAHIRLEAPHMWSPEDPYLYRFTLTAGEDRVDSYFALRTLETKVIDGIPRLCLNGSPYFFHGLLDQGYFSDGIFTPATAKGYENDILAMKALGFNTLRKHIKLEPQQFYYDCDRLGMIVFQDMVNNGGYSFLRDTALPTVGLQKLCDKWLHPNKRSRKAFIETMEETVHLLQNHPSVCYWTIFNEGWGQFASAGMYERLRALDSTRFIDTTSGWFRGAPSDVESLHVYFKPFRMRTSDKPLVLSEFGGYAHKVEGHVFNRSNTYGYRFFAKQEDFANALEKLYCDEIIPAAKERLCAAIYTQVSDVEDETNGLLTYDRRFAKVDAARMTKIAEKLKL